MALRCIQSKIVGTARLIVILSQAFGVVYGLNPKSVYAQSAPQDLTQKYGPEIERAAKLFDATYRSSGSQRYVAGTVRKVQRGRWGDLSFEIDVFQSSNNSRFTSNATALIDGTGRITDWSVGQGYGGLTIPKDANGIAALKAQIDLDAKKERQIREDRAAVNVVKARCLREEGLQRRNHTKEYVVRNQIGQITGYETRLVEDRSATIYRNICSVDVIVNCAADPLFQAPEHKVVWKPNEQRSAMLGDKCGTPNR
jgi:hypothetical protein